MEWIDKLNQLPLITGPLLVIAGVIMYRFPPKKINFLYGYRTMRAMRSQERWDFSQKYSSKEMVKTGFLILPFSLLGLFEVYDGIINSMVIVSIFLPILRTEMTLRRKFPTAKN